MLNDTMQAVWRTRASERQASFGTVITDGQRLYTQVEGITTYELGTGHRIWQVGGVVAGQRNIVVDGGRVYASEGVARAFDSATGSELWQFRPDTLADYAYSAVDGRAFYIGTRSNHVYALDVSAGQPLWKVLPLSEIRYHAIIEGIITSGDTVYVAITDDTSPTGHLKRGWIVALDRYTGEILWRYVNERTGEPHDAGDHSVAGRILLVNDYRGGAFFGLDRFTGKEIWRYTGPADRYGATDTFQVSDGVAYLASLDAHAYAVDPETGRILWKTDVKGSAHSSAVCGKHLYVSAGMLYKLRRSDGKVEAAYFGDEWGYVGNEFVTSRLLAQEGRLYFVTNQAIYAVECG